MDIRSSVNRRDDAEVGLGKQRRDGYLREGRLRKKCGGMERWMEGREC